jgi:hypothetical protein
MNRFVRTTLVFAVFVAAACLLVRGRSAAGQAGYQVVNLISDTPGAARVTDPAVTDAWGIAFAHGGPFFMVNTNSSVATSPPTAPRRGSTSTTPILN